MRTLAVLVLVLLPACAPEAEAERAADSEPAAAAVEIAGAPMSVPAKAPLMDLPSDPAALKRLQDMGYTVHEDHLHAPGVNACPKMGDGPVM